MWATGSLIESRAASEVTFDTGTTAGDYTISFQIQLHAATNCFTTGSKIAFMCFEDGIMAHCK